MSGVNRISTELSSSISIRMTIEDANRTVINRRRQFYHLTLGLEEAKLGLKGSFFFIIFMQACACVVGWHHMCANICKCVDGVNKEVVLAK